MPSKKKTALIEWEESSGNVFADLGLDDADELFTRAQSGSTGLPSCRSVTLYAPTGAEHCAFVSAPLRYLLELNVRHALCLLDET